MNSKKIYKKVITIFNILFFTFYIAISLNNVYAADDFWGQASSWFENASTTDVTDIKSGVEEVITTFSNMVNVIGTAVIIIITIFLGIKYIFGSFEGKAEVKESMVTLLIACVFFFGWTSIWNILYVNGNLVIFSNSDTSINNAVNRIYSIFIYIANFLAIGGVIYIGIRYIFASASGKADLKSKSPQLILGIVLAFASVNVLSFVSTAVNQATKKAANTNIQAEKDGYEIKDVSNEKGRVIIYYNTGTIYCLDDTGNLYETLDEGKTCGDQKGQNTDLAKIVNSTQVTMYSNYDGTLSGKTVGGYYVKTAAEEYITSTSGGKESVSLQKITSDIYQVIYSGEHGVYTSYYVDLSSVKK